jgi:hypothetical protein
MRRRGGRGAGDVVVLSPEWADIDVGEHQALDAGDVVATARWLTSQVTALDAVQLREAMYYLIGHCPDAVGKALADLQERRGRLGGRHARKP